MAATVSVLPTGVASAATGTSPGNLTAVSAASASEAWAVGCKSVSNTTCPNNGQDAAEHWNGTAWKAVPVPMPHASVPPAEGQLNGVKDLAPSNAWAVGYASFPETAQILHWDGKVWKQMPVPSLGSLIGTNYPLNGIGGTSASDLWAVGSDTSGGGLILHYNGTKWSRVPSPNPGVTYLNAVYATSATNAWAVGDDSGTCSCNQALILHWDGKTWKVAFNGLPGTESLLTSVNASSASDAWAGGWSEATGNYTLTMHWNGTSWKRVTTGLGVGNPNGFTHVFGVAATSATNAWAVSDVHPMLHWNGQTWASQAVPAEPGSTWGLSGIAATSATNAWAVGSYTNPEPHFVLLHWNGSWARIIV